MAIKSLKNDMATKNMCLALVSMPIICVKYDGSTYTKKKRKLVAIYEIQLILV